MIDPVFLAVTDELARVAEWADCTLCGKQYRDDPAQCRDADDQPCLLAGHIEGHAAVVAYREMRYKLPG